MMPSRRLKTPKPRLAIASPRFRLVAVLGGVLMIDPEIGAAGSVAAVSRRNTRRL
jgi:hypothetical protein